MSKRLDAFDDEEADDWALTVENRIEYQKRQFDLERYMLGGYAAALIVVLSGVTLSADKLGIVGLALAVALLFRLLNSVLDYAALLRHVNTAITALRTEITRAKLQRVADTSFADSESDEAEKKLMKIVGRLKWDLWIAGAAVISIALASLAPPVCRTYDCWWNVLHEIHGWFV